jgi:hypothetical protein
MSKEGDAIHVAPDLFSERTSGYGGKPARDPFRLGHGWKSRDPFYASYRYWYKRAFLAWQTPDALVFSEGSGVEPHRPNFGISVCFQLFWG